MEVIWLVWLVLLVALDLCSMELYLSHQLLIGYIMVYIICIYICVCYVFIDSIYTERYMGTPSMNPQGYEV